MTWTMYIVHVERINGSVAHAIGLTHRENLRMRLWEHQRGKGSALLFCEHRLGGYLTTTQLELNATHGIEQLYKSASQFTMEQSMCPICKQVRSYLNAKEETA